MKPVLIDDLENSPVCYYNRLALLRKTTRGWHSNWHLRIALPQIFCSQKAWDQYECINSCANIRCTTNCPLEGTLIYCIYTGRFIMYSGITKIYYRKTVGHVFTKQVQIEGTTQTFTENWVSVQAEIKWSPINCWRWRWKGFGPVFCIVRRNQRELQLRSYRCRKQKRGGFCVSVWCEQFH